MDRRAFLRYAALAAASAAWPMSTALRERADRSLWVYVRAAGGWDPRLMFDPSRDAQQSRRFREIRALGPFRHVDITSDPMPLGLARGTGIEDALLGTRTFLERHGDCLTVFNGVDASGAAVATAGATALAPPMIDGDDPLADLRALRAQIEGALDVLQRGDVRVASIVLGGFDTYARHDHHHARQLLKLWSGLDFLRTRAAERGLDDRLFVVAHSDSGRAPRYTGSAVETAGKTDWPITSTLVLGPGLGSRVVGATDRQLFARPLDPITLEPSDGGVVLTQQLVFAALRSLGAPSSEPLSGGLPLFAPHHISRALVPKEPTWPATT